MATEEDGALCAPTIIYVYVLDAGPVIQLGSWTRVRITRVQVTEHPDDVPTDIKVDGIVNGENAPSPIVDPAECTIDGLPVDQFYLREHYDLHGWAMPGGA